MSDRRLEVAEAKLHIYRAACISAGRLLSSPRETDLQWVEGARDLLVQATYDAAEIDKWLPLGKIRSGSVFKTAQGLQYAKTCARHLAGILCVSLVTGAREELDSNTLVCVLPIEKGETA